MAAWEAFCSFCGVVVSVSLLLYTIPLLLLSAVPRFRTQDLRVKYGDWAVVTGASSGIGLSIARKFAAQGINVCVVALDDKLFAPSIAGLRAGFPAVQIRAVPVNLAADPQTYTKVIKDATAECVPAPSRPPPSHTCGRLSWHAPADKPCFVPPRVAQHPGQHCRQQCRVPPHGVL
jgi:hypothetical protein